MSDLFNPKAPDLSSSLQTPGPIANFTAIYFLQNTHQSPIISINLGQKQASRSLIEASEFSLVVEILTTQFGQRLLSRSADVLIKCQIQTFMKPLGSIHEQKIWESLASTVLHNEQKEYRLQFQPAQINRGFYSLQLLLLTSGARSLPLLFEVPVIQVNSRKNSIQNR